MKKINYIILLTILLTQLCQVKSQEISIEEKIFNTVKNYRLCHFVDCKSMDDNLQYLPFNKNYYNTQSLNKIKDILENKWDENEKLNIAKQAIIKSIESQKSDLSNILSDSINYKINKRRKEIFKNKLNYLEKIDTKYIDTIPGFSEEISIMVSKIDEFVIPHELILLAGYLDQDYFIPILRKSLNDSLIDNTLSIELALSRYLIEPYHSSIIKKNIPNNLENLTYQESNAKYDYAKKVLLYICSQESIFEFSKLLKLPLNIPNELVNSHDDVDFIPIPYIVLEDLLVVVKNEKLKNFFIKKYKTSNFQASLFDKKDIEFAINWLEKEFSNYVLDRNLFFGVIIY